MLGLISAYRYILLPLVKKNPGYDKSLKVIRGPKVHEYMLENSKKL